MRRTPIILALVLAAGLAPRLPAAPARSWSGAFDRDAIYADGSSLYVSPQEPTDRDWVTLKLRVRKDNISGASLRYGDRSLAMVRQASAGAYEWWYAELPPRRVPTGYWFEVRQGDLVAYYSRRGLEEQAPDFSYQFKILPNFKVPAWSKGAVLYQIYVDRFRNGDPTNDVVDDEYLYDNWPAVGVEDWDALPDAVTPYAKGGNRTREFFGGDLEGVIRSLDYLKDLGVEGIYLNPIFVSPSNHKYDAQDYEHVDPHFGAIVKDGGRLVDPESDPNYAKPGAQDASLVNREAERYRLRTTDEANLAASDEKFRELVAQAHARGIKVILDGVFNHAGSFNKWLDREGLYPDEEGPGAYESADSPYRDYFSFSRDDWPGNESYETWSGFKTLPKLNFEGSQELVDTILGLGAKWVGPEFRADGWRLDVAADLGRTPRYNHWFWQEFRKSVKAANPEALILAEVYGDSSSWLLGNEWDTVMNYDAFFEPVGWYLTGLEKHSYYYREGLHNNTRAFVLDMRDKMAKLPYQSLESSMNQLSNHDHSRFLTRTSGFVDDRRSTSDVSPQDKAEEGVNKGILKEATLLQMTMPGAPTLYYGDEVGLAGFTDPDSRRTFPWGREDQELLGFFKAAIALRKEYPALRTGSFAFLPGVSYGMVSLGRWDAESVAAVAINNYKEARDLDIEVGPLGLEDGDVLELALTMDASSHAAPRSRHVVSGGVVSVSVPAFGGVVLAARNLSREPAPDAVARPGLVAVSPRAGSSVRGASAQVWMEFSTDMNKRDIETAFSIFPAVEGRFSWNGRKVHFLPSAPLAPGRYEVRLGREISAREGGFRLEEGRTWSFEVLR